MSDERSPKGWTVLDPGVGIWSHRYVFKPPSGSATSFAVRCAPGKILVISPGVGLPDGAMDQLAGWGEVAYLLAPNGFHHLGVASWRARFPSARVFAPERAAPRIAKQSSTAGSFEAIDQLFPLLGEHVVIYDVPNSKCGESWCRVKGAKGYYWFVSDILANIERLPKPLLLRALFKWSGSAPGYRVFNLGLKFIVNDKRAVLRAMLEDMREHPPVCVVPSHGAILDHPSLWPDTEALLQSQL